MKNRKFGRRPASIRDRDGHLTRKTAAPPPPWLLEVSVSESESESGAEEQQEHERAAPKKKKRSLEKIIKVRESSGHLRA